VNQPTILFVCEHGAAKSILAAAFFNTLARENDLRLTAIARGTHPDSDLSSKTVAGLLADGLTPAETIPRILTREEIESAQRVVSFCELPDEYRHNAAIEYWDGVPPVSEGYEKSRDAIVSKLKDLVRRV
jgi:arsenate reductase (thioredoxin)